MHNHHIAQLDASDEGRERQGIPEQNVSISDVRMPVDRDGNLCALRGRLAKAALLRFPLVDLDQVDIGP